ncbi:MAG: metalloprotease, partial [Verrucomicrobia bacterium]|nr:metalloprotease [Verrucomicrobiota bacterium]
RTIRDCEIYLAVEPDQFGPPAARATLKKTKAPQRIECRPAAARYVKLRALSEINGGPWASAAEIGVEGR